MRLWKKMTNMRYAIYFKEAGAFEAPGQTKEEL